MAKVLQQNVFTIERMTIDYAQEIAYNWKYRGKYSFYNITKDQHELEIFLDEKLRKSIYFAVLNEKAELIGFYSYTFENGVMWIGIGLKPKLTGKGYGTHFMQKAIEFGVSEFGYTESKILLTVAEFNKRAIYLYQKLGFIFIEKKELSVNSKIHSHWVMGKKLINGSKHIINK